MYIYSIDANPNTTHPGFKGVAFLGGLAVLLDGKLAFKDAAASALFVEHDSSLA